MGDPRRRARHRCLIYVEPRDGRHHSLLWAGPRGAISDYRCRAPAVVEGNRVRLLKDARENYPSWLDAIGAAKHYIHFESYIIHDDAVGDDFSDALIARVRDGVSVRVIYDWMGGFCKTSRKFWRRLRAGGVEVRRVAAERLFQFAAVSAQPVALAQKSVIESP